MRKWNALVSVPLITSMLVAAPTALAASNNRQVNTVVNGHNLTASLNPMIMNGSTWVRVRAFADCLGASLSYSNGVIDVMKGATTVSFTIGSNQATVNGRASLLPKKVWVTAGSAYVPLRFLANQYGYDLQWDGANEQSTVLPSTQLKAEWAQITQILQKEQTSMKNLNSFGLHLTVEANIANGMVPSEQLKLSGALDGTYNKQPLAVSATGSLTISGAPVSIAIQAYFSGNKLYFLNPLNKQWHYMTIDFATIEKMIAANTSQNATNEQNAMNTMLPLMSLTDTQDSWLISMNVNSMAMKSMLASAAPVHQMPTAASALDGLNFMMHVQLTIKKATDVLTGISMDLSAAPNPEEKLGIMIQGTLDQFNSAPTVTVPADVLKNATMISSPFSMMGAGTMIPAQKTN